MKKEKNAKQPTNKPTKTQIAGFESMPHYDGTKGVPLILRRARHNKTLYTFVDVIKENGSEVYLRDQTLEQDVLIDLKNDIGCLRMCI